MLWLKLAWANLRHTPLVTVLNIVLLGLGTATIVVMLLVSDQLSRTLARDAQGIDLVVGAKGSPLQLVLSSVYHADIPTGNIPLAQTQTIAADRQVALAVPIALGDSVQGFRIVGTTREFLALYSAELDRGQPWAGAMQAVIGAAVARQGGMDVGSTFAGSHGLSATQSTHTHAPYRVTGVLAPTGTVLDRLVLTALDSVWQVHDPAPRPGAPESRTQHEVDGHDLSQNHDHNHPHERPTHGEQGHGPDLPSTAEKATPVERDITALLVRYATPMAALQLPREINAEPGLQAAAPAFELARLLQLLGMALEALQVFAGVLVLTAGFSVFTALYGALDTRRFDIAMLRCLGATRRQVLFSMLAEGLLLGVLGVALGLALGHGVVALLGAWLESTRGVMISGAGWLPAETGLVIALIGMGVLAALIPALGAYRRDVARTLAEG